MTFNWLSQNTSTQYSNSLTQLKGICFMLFFIVCQEFLWKMYSVLSSCTLSLTYSNSLTAPKCIFCLYFHSFLSFWGLHLFTSSKHFHSRCIVRISFWDSIWFCPFDFRKKPTKWWTICGSSDTAPVTCWGRSSMFITGTGYGGVGALSSPTVILHQISILITLLQY